MSTPAPTGYVVLAALLLLPSMLAAQSPSKETSLKRTTVPKLGPGATAEPAIDEQIAGLKTKVRDLEMLMTQNPDISSNASLKDMVKSKWVFNSCLLEYKQALAVDATLAEDGAFYDSLIAACTKRLQTDSPGRDQPPVVLPGADQAKYSCTATGGADERARICVNDAARNDMTLVQSNGELGGGSDTITGTANDSVVAQVRGRNTGAKGALTLGTAQAHGPTSVVVGGVEYAGYSSQAQTTDGFFEIFYQGPSGPRFPGLRGWTRIRLTSASQPATNGVVSLVSNPAGLSAFNYSSVGQALDFVAGSSWQFPKLKYWELITDIGATTPLSSQDKPIEFTAPAAGTVECTLLVNRFSPANGYNPGLSLNPATGSTNCLAGNYQDIAFANQDRSSFFLKYGGGVRTWYPLGSCSTANCATSYSAADITIGQDAAVTGGKLRRLVLKVDGLLPIKTGSSAFLYLFGSAYVRMERDNNLPPLFLATPTSPMTVPSPNVIVLPLVQPNRDYYRLGVGPNINQLWCKIYSSTCSNAIFDNAGTATTASIKSISPQTVPAAPAKDVLLTVTGSNFADGMVVKLNDTGMKTQFLSATQLSATIPQAELKSKGKFNVAVVSKTGDTSNTVVFTVN